MEFVDKALARRLEAAEEMPQVHYARLYQKVRPEVGAAVEEICGGHMVFAGVGSPIGRAGGLGLDNAVSASDLDRVEEFYRSHGAPAQVDVCPLTDPSLLELLKLRGYTMTELNNVLYRQLSRRERFPPPPSNIKLRPAEPHEAELWADVVGRGFREGEPCPPDFLQMFTPLFQIPNAVTFLASLNGKLAGGAGGLIVPERKLLALFGAATLPEFRGRGIQTAFLHLRMQAAAKAGCDLAVTVTLGGSTSQRNAERAGFRVAYSKATLLKAFEPARPPSKRQTRRTRLRSRSRLRR
jgi:GNAT superfamily N-acetyltransferase